MSYYSSRSFLGRDRIPVTLVVLAVCAVLFFVDFLTRGAIGPFFGFHVAGARLLSPLWTPLAYPLINSGFLYALFGLLWLWWIGGSLERSWGSKRYGVFLVGITLFTVLCVWIGCLVLHVEWELAGLFSILAALTVAWATINPTQEVLLYFFIRLQARWLALIIVGIDLFMGYLSQPILGLFWLLSPVAAWLYVRNGYSAGRPILDRRPPARGPDLRFSTTAPPRREGDGARWNPFAWYRRWQERRHLEKLWRNSGFSDKDDRKRQ